MRDRVASGESFAVNGEGRGTRASAAAKSGACGEGEAVPAGRSSRKLPSSGTQMFSQMSQLALALMGKDEGAPEAAGVTVKGSSTSPR